MQMIIRSLKELVDDAKASLMNTGRFRDGWLEEYQATLEKALDFYDGPSWPKDVFSSLHFVSTHLCLRYLAHKGRAAASIAETESILGRIHLETEVVLWTAVTRVPRWDTEPLLGANEVELISLCFGSLSPVQPVAEQTSFVTWKNAFNERLDNLREAVRRADHWSKWLCTALHFAAFYVDLYQQQDFSLDEESACGAANSVVHKLISKLSNHVDNHRVLRLIEIWLESSSIGRNSSGLPQVGKPRPRTGQFISVRTPAELLIQSSMG